MSNLPLSNQLFLLFVCLPFLSLAADDKLRVDPDAGDDNNDGKSKPVKTINRAIKLAGPGDTIQLKPGTYFETVDFSNKHGQPDKPITLDGNGAVIDGSREVKHPQWRKVYKNTYRAEAKTVYPNFDNLLADRFFMIWNGRLKRMGRCCKLEKNYEFQDTRHIMKGEWTYSKYYKAFLLVTDPNKQLADEKIRYPALKNAVVLSGAGSWITIKDLTGIRVYNDGFSITGNQKNIVLENVGAMDCGDDGFSVGGEAEVTVRGLMSIGNATGIYNVDKSVTHYSNVLIKDCIAYDLCFKGKQHTIENGVIDSLAPCPLLVDTDEKEDTGCEVTLKNLRLAKVNKIDQGMKVAKSGRLNAHNCQFFGLDLVVTGGGEVELQGCSIAQGKVQPDSPDVEIAADAVWKGDNNRYNIGTLKMGETSFTPDSFAQFKSLINSETASRWSN